MDNRKGEVYDLTVIIPVHKMSGRLHEVRLMIEAATSYNVIVVHDVGDFETGEQLKEIIDSNQARTISLIEGNFGSPGAARNAGLRVANSTWVTFWDCDDRPIFKTYKEFMENESSKYGTSDLVIYNFGVEDLHSENFRIFRSKKNQRNIFIRRCRFKRRGR